MINPGAKSDSIKIFQSKGCIPVALKPAITLLGVAARGRQLAIAGMSWIDIVFPGWLNIHESQALLTCFLRGP